MERDNLETLGNRLKYILKSQSISNTKLAERVDIDESYVSKIINKNSIPSKALLEKICSELAINYTWLKSGEGSIYQSESSPEYLKAFNKFNKLDIRFQNFALDVLDNLLKLETELKDENRNN